MRWGTKAAPRFRCKLDGRPFSACRSPKTYAGLAPGAHVFKVEAVGPTGRGDLSPATYRFRIPHPPARVRP
jgi:hypothetical protein